MILFIAAVAAKNKRGKSTKARLNVIHHALFLQVEHFHGWRKREAQPAFNAFVLACERDAISLKFVG